MVGKDLKLGKLVWAKMKGFSFWPGYVAEPPTDTKKKAQHYIYFYGTNNCAWIPDENIKLHSEEEIRKAKLKKVSSSLQNAIDKIVSESKLLNKGEQITAEEELPQTEALISSDKVESVPKKKLTSNVKITTKNPKKPALSKSIPKSPKKVVSEITPKSPKNAVDSEATTKSSIKAVISEGTSQSSENVAFSEDFSKPSTSALVSDTIPQFRKPMISKIIPRSHKKPVLSQIIPKSPKLSASAAKKSKQPQDKILTVTKAIEYSESDKVPGPKDFIIVKTFIKPPMKHSPLDTDAVSPKSKILKVEGATSVHSSTTPVAVIKPNVDSMNNAFSPGSALLQREYVGLIPPPEIDLYYKSETIKKRSILPTKKRIGVMGLGTIGGRIARNLINFGHSVTVWSRNSEKSKRFKDIGATVAETPSDVVEDSDLIINCVSGPLAAKTVVFGNCGVLQGFDKTKGEIIEKGYVEMTTIDPETSKEISEAITQKGGRYVEAPISGSRTLADDGCLLVLGAGNRDLFNDMDSVFATICASAYYVGCVIGSGAQMSLIMSMYLGTMYASVGESIALVERLGLDRNKFLEILDINPLGCKHLIEKGEAMLRSSFETDTSLKYQQQKMRMALTLNESQPLIVASNANEVFKRAKLLRYMDHDVAAVYFGAKY